MDNAWVWIVGILALCGVIGLAVWRGRAGDFSFGLKGLRVNLPTPQPVDHVTVADHAKVHGTAGEIIGRDITGSQSPKPGGRVTEVGSGMVVGPGGQVGSIVGERVTASGTAPKKPRT